MKTLTSRERVARTLAHQEPDLVPIDIGSTACWFVDTAYEQIKKRLGLNSQGDLFRLGENAAYYDKELLNQLDTDFRHVYLRPSRVDWDAWNASDKTSFTDEWGIQRRRVESSTDSNWEKVSNPLANATEADLDNYPWPDPSDPARVEGLDERAHHLWEKTDYAIAARAVSHGIFELAWELRGMEQFMVDMLQNEPFARKLMRKILDVQLGLYGVFLDAVGPYVQVVQTADDYGSQNGPLFSPRLYRKYILPYRQELNRLIHAKAPHARVQHHTCGSVYRLMPELVETGIEVLNPVQPLAADMDPARLKAEYGTKLTFHGAVDEQHALNGSVEDVKAEVAARVRALAPGGGYILAPCSNFQADTPPDNVLTMIETARTVGRYPIQ